MSLAPPVAKTKSNRGRKPSPEGPRGTVTFKCRDDYRRWLIRFAKFERVTPSQVIDRALAEHATARGFDEPPER